jgi:hypothetical protein
LNASNVGFYEHRHPDTGHRSQLLQRCTIHALLPEEQYCFLAHLLPPDDDADGAQDERPRATTVTTGAAEDTEPKGTATIDAAEHYHADNGRVIDKAFRDHFKNSNKRCLSPELFSGPASDVAPQTFLPFGCPLFVLLICNTTARITSEKRELEHLRELLCHSAMTGRTTDKYD